MKPFYFTIDESVWTMDIPDADVQMDCHPALTYSWTLDPPYQALTYICDGINELSGDQVQEMIERITNYRTNSTL
jgi:hypothetical protein